jgi:hypothetical protein
MKESFEDTIQRIMEEEDVTWAEAEDIFFDTQAEVAEQAYDLSIGN